jgi:hypothetical protein
MSEIFSSQFCRVRGYVALLVLLISADYICMNVQHYTTRNGLKSIWIRQFCLIRIGKIRIHHDIESEFNPDQDPDPQSHWIRIHNRTLKGKFCPKFKQSNEKSNCAFLLLILFTPRIWTPNLDPQQNFYCSSSLPPGSGLQIRIHNRTFIAHPLYPPDLDSKSESTTELLLLIFFPPGSGLQIRIHNLAMRQSCPLAAELETKCKAEMLLYLYVRKIVAVISLRKCKKNSCFYISM